MKTTPAPTRQTGAYAEELHMSALLQQQFILFCKLLQVPPATMLLDFADTLAHSSWKRKGREKAREYLRAYIQEMGYGRPRYQPTQVQQMLTELDAIGMLYPEGADIATIATHTAWRRKYHSWWLKKWKAKAVNK